MKKLRLPFTFIIVCILMVVACNNSSTPKYAGAKAGARDTTKNGVAEVSTENVQPINKYAEKVITLSGNLNSYSLDQGDDIGDSTMTALGDSIDATNVQIVSLLEQHGGAFNTTDLAAINNKDGIKVISSQDGNVVIFSWDRGDYVQPPMAIHNSVLCCKVNGEKTAVHCGEKKGDFKLGYNLSVDSVYQTTYHGQPLYLVLGSNSCGSACVIRELIPLLLTGNSVTDTCKVFRLNDSSYNDLQLTYHLNTRIDSALTIRFDSTNNTVYVPVINSEQDGVTGERRYSIDK